MISATNAKASGVSPYLPLQTDPIFENELARLASIAKMPILTKPYHAKTVLVYLEKIKESHPSLYRRINNYIDRYKKQAAITHASVALSYSSDLKVPLDNQRGVDINDTMQSSILGFYQLNDHVIANFGGSTTDGNIRPYGTYLSVGWDVLQVDLGYREQWLSPHLDSALLRSTQAKPFLNATVSNSALLTDWNIKYEFSVGLLSESDEILYQDELTTGKPGYMTMHLSFQATDWWTIGFNRSYMFGGGGRSVDLKDIWNAIIDPVNNDNCGGEGTDLQDCDKEVGNQIASITQQFNFQVSDVPITLNYEYAGEDTKGHKNTQLGNTAHAFGLFLPYLTESTSLNIEHTKFDTHWYVHHIYGDGYTNKDNVMGHWWGDFKGDDDKSRGKAFSAKIKHEYSKNTVLTLFYKYAEVKNSTAGSPDVGHQVELTASTLYKNYFIDLKLGAGQDRDGEDFYRTSLAFRW